MTPPNNRIEHMFVEHLYDSMRSTNVETHSNICFILRDCRLKLDVSSGRPPMHMCVHTHEGETMTERPISDRHRAILRVINDKLASSGFPPSVREIASAVGLASPSTVKHHLDALEADGLPRARTRAAARPRPHGQARTRARRRPLVRPRHPVVPIEIPVSHVEEEGTRYPARRTHCRRCAHHRRAARRRRFPPAHLHDGHGDLFMLEVSGQSMIDAGIFDGDYVVIRSQNDAATASSWQP